MEQKTKKCYVLMVAKNFPATHPRMGEKTQFIEKIRKGLKKHTIRSNYQLWEKRIAEVRKGNAYLSLRQWEGKPYRSKQIECLQLHNNDVGIERLDKDETGYKINNQDTHYNERDFAKNDGLLKADFLAWFKGAKYPMAIIHFSQFRYGNN